MQQITNIQTVIKAISVFPDRRTYDTNDAYAQDVASWLSDNKLLSEQLSSFVPELDTFIEEMNTAIAELVAIQEVCSGAVIYQGEWNPTTEYSTAHSTSVNGEFYTSKTNSNIGHTPSPTSDYWFKNPTSTDVTTLIARLSDKLDKTATASDSARLNGKLANDYALASHEHDIGDSSTLNDRTNSTGSTPKTIVERDSGGDITGRLFRPEYAVLNPTINFIMTQVATGKNTDNYVRPSTPAQIANALEPHIGTTSVSNPSGGSDGDIWFQY